jgi:hypothetical protein
MCLPSFGQEIREQRRRNPGLLEQPVCCAPSLNKVSAKTFRNIVILSKENTFMLKNAVVKM